jgi:hypothetical protein
MTPALVRFPKDVLERIDVLVGGGRRPQFIREAVENELTRRERSVPAQKKPPSSRKSRGSGGPK